MLVCMLCLAWHTDNLILDGGLQVVEEVPHCQEVLGDWVNNLLQLVDDILETCSSKQLQDLEEFCGQVDVGDFQKIL